MLKLKFLYFGHLIRRTYSLEKTLILGKIEGKRRKGQQRIRCLGHITDSWSTISTAIIFVIHLLFICFISHLVVVSVCKFRQNF